MSTYNTTDFLDRYSKPDADGLFVVTSPLLEEGQIITFDELERLKEEVDRLFSEEQNRILMASLSGDLICDSCNI